MLKRPQRRFTLGGFIHLLLVIAIVLFLVRLLGSASRYCPVPLIREQSRCSFSSIESAVAVHLKVWQLAL